MSTGETLLITGASGRMGRRVVERLLDEHASGAGRIIAATRSPEKLADLAARGAIVKKADFDEPGALVDAFAGADRLLLISTDMPTMDRRSAIQVEAIHAAKRAGVKHVFYTSLVEPGPENPTGALMVAHRETEEALQASGLTWTLLRNGIYSDILFMPGLAHGVPMGNVGRGSVAFVSREDCAAVAASALLEAGRYEDRILNVTGPAAIGATELGAIISDVLGRPFTVRALSDEAYIASLTSRGMPREHASIYAGMGPAAEGGWFSHVSKDVEDVTGRPATPLHAFLHENREALLAAVSG